MHLGISKKRFIRELVRKWRFITFVKIMTKRKLELMYKNLHISYLQIANDVFGDDNKNISLIKEFERFGNDVGLFENENYLMSQESSFCRKVNKKYVFDTLDTDNFQLMDDYYKNKRGIKIKKEISIETKNEINVHDDDDMNFDDKKNKTFNKRRKKDDESENEKRSYRNKKYEKK